MRRDEAANQREKDRREEMDLLRSLVESSRPTTLSAGGAGEEGTARTVQAQEKVVLAKFAEGDGRRGRVSDHIRARDEWLQGLPDAAQRRDRAGSWLRTREVARGRPRRRRNGHMLQAQQEQQQRWLQAQQEEYHQRREEQERAQEEQQRWLQAQPEERATRSRSERRKSSSGGCRRNPKSGLPEERATRRMATLMDSHVSGAPTEYLVGAGEGGRDVMELNYRCIICVCVSHVA